MTKKDMIIREFDPVIYPLKVWIAKNPSPTKLKELFIELTGGTLTFIFDKRTIASTYNRVVENVETGKYGILIILSSNKLSVKAIAHEATHAVRYIWEGLSEEVTGIEADAYLAGWVAECINKVVKNK